jgi:MFS family permease
MFKHITKNIWLLSIVSLFTDFASEMLYPIMPIYLKSIGFSVLLIGVLEGLAEAVAGLSKGYFGQKSDVMQKRLPFVQMGYSLSALSKPMMALFVAPLWVLFARVTDRIGKGIRTGARDALLSDETTPANKGRIFGFHRSMDTFGAVLGPAAALLFLYHFPGDYINLFYLAFFPGLLAILATFLLKEKPKKSIGSKTKQKISFLSFVNYWKTAPKNYRVWAGALLFFALINSSDVFLLLKMKENGLSDQYVIGIYIFYNLVYALFAFPIGIVADKVGLKKMLFIGIALFVFAYLGMYFSEHSPGYAVFIIVFLLYGLYAAATEGVAKALLSNISDPSDTATAIGTYSAFQSIAALIASALAGFLWFSFGSSVVFIFSAMGALVTLVFLSLQSFKH